MITSRQNDHFKTLKNLQKKRAREISRVSASDLSRVYTCTDQSYPCETVRMSKGLIEEVTYRGGDAIAVVKKQKISLDGLEFFIVADGMEKPGNVGAILRTADATGFQGIVSVGEGVDIYSPNVIRASLGAFFTQRVVTSTKQEIIEYCKKEEIPIYSATPEAKTSLYHIQFPTKMCIVVGSEAFGVSDILKNASTCFSLPMYGEIDSLNASTAFGIIAYEIIRQRNFI